MATAKTTKSTPTKITTKVVKEDTNVVGEINSFDIEDLIAKSIAKALADQEKKHKQEVKEMKKELEVAVKEAAEAKIKVEVETKKSKKSGNTYKFIPSNTKIRIKSNVAGKFNFTEDRGKVRVFLELKDSGDTQLLDYDEFKVITTKDYFKNGILAIEDVYSENGDVTIQDVALDANVAHLYKEDGIQVNDLTTLFTDEISQADYEKFLLDNKQVAETVLDYAYQLHRVGSLKDLSKANFLKTGFNNINLFK